MKYFRTILAGMLVWAMVASTFIILGFIPGIKESLQIQEAIIAFLVVPYSILGAMFLFRTGLSSNGLVSGMIMACTALFLDLTLTVPFVEIPKGNSYLGFFSDPILWILVLENVMTVFIYWKIRTGKTIERKKEKALY